MNPSFAGHFRIPLSVFCLLFASSSFAETIEGRVEFHGAESGEFKIENVPPGNYSLTAWHETVGEQVVEVAVDPGQTARAVFHYGQKLAQSGSY
jgi:hypothetical protein